ncbi:transposase family protein [Ruania alba]|uniref:transposase family protein n=1 Tax=Ruania alba TaxID=648782 RepID=UPI000B7E61C2
MGRRTPPCQPERSGGLHAERDLAWVCEHTPGRTHDARGLRDSGILDMRTAIQIWATKMYPAGGHQPDTTTTRKEQHASQRKLNTEVNSIRDKIEQVIAHLRSWRPSGPMAADRCEYSPISLHRHSARVLPHFNLNIPPGRSDAGSGPDLHPRAAGCGGLCR